MEESEKRKERLKAMRMGATQSELIGTQNASVPAPQNNLVNPLNQVNSTPRADSSSPFPRFDYYTDPMAAFHGNRRDVNVNHTWRNNFHNHPGSFLPPPPPPPFQGGPRQQPYMSVTPTPANHFQVNYHSPYEIRSPNPQSPQWSRPQSARGTTWIRSPGPSGHGPGRGGTHGTNSSNSGWKSDNECEQSFYNREMIKDPWRCLKPCPGNILVPFTNLGTAPDEWVPKPKDTKKPKVDVTLNKSSLSIAEYIAQSFEATKDVKNT